MPFLGANVSMSLFNYPAALVGKPDGHTWIVTASCCNVIKISNKAQDKTREMFLI